MSTYKIVRFYQIPGTPRRVMETDLSLDEAQEHCSDPESSSSTATNADAEAHTREHGDWFDGYTKED